MWELETKKGLKNAFYKLFGTNQKKKEQLRKKGIVTGNDLIDTEHKIEKSETFYFGNAYELFR